MWERSYRHIEFSEHYELDVHGVALNHVEKECVVGVFNVVKPRDQPTSKDIEY